VVTPTLAGKFLRITYKMQHRFLGLDNRVQIQILLWRVFAHLIFLVAALANADNVDNKEETTFQINAFITRLKYVQRICTEFDTTAPPEIESLIETANQMLAPPSQSQNILNPLSQAASTTHLLSLLSAFTPTHIVLGYQLKCISGAITSPVNTTSPTTTTVQPEKLVYDVYSVFPLRIDVDATLENISNISNVKILVNLPDGTRRVFQVEPTYFLPTRPLTYRIKAFPILLHINKTDWPNDQDYITITIVNAYTADVQHPDLDLLATVDLPARESPFIALCKPMSYCIFPRDK